MSRSNQTELINPAVKFISWKGSDGTLEYFDKSLGEKGENVPVGLPFGFMILDRVYQVTGGLDDNNGYIGFWSNAVKKLKTQKLIVRSKRGVEVEGLYEQIKGYPGARFMQGLYIAFKEDEGLMIGYLKLKGAALSAWFDFTKKHRNIYEGAFSITGNVKKRKGSNDYFEPVFKHIADVTEESDAAAQALDADHLQPYLIAYFDQVAEPQFTGNALQETYSDEPPEMAPIDWSQAAPPDDNEMDIIPF